MKKYDYLIFDADSTLISFFSDQKRAISLAFEGVGVVPTADMVSAVSDFSYADWADLGLSDVHLPAIQSSYHKLYHTHVRHIGEYMDTMYGLNGRRDEAERIFVQSLRLAGHTYEDTEGTLKALSEKYELCVATNGIAAMQRDRLSSLMPPLSKLFISEEMGCIKPMRAFFESMLSSLGTTSDRCLMIGDSIASDIVGAQTVGMDSVWIKRKEGTPPEGVKVISNLRELLEFL